MVLEAGAKIKLTTDEAFKEKCTAELLYLDYQNLTQVLQIGKRVFIDDGLISVSVFLWWLFETFFSYTYFLA